MTESKNWEIRGFFQKTKLIKIDNIYTVKCYHEKIHWNKVAAGH